MSVLAVTPGPPARRTRRRNGWRVAARLAVGGVRTAPGRALLTVIALTIGVALMAVDQGRGSVEASLMTIGITVVTVTALAAARIPDPVRLRTSAMLELVGARGSVRRRMAVVDVGLSAVVAVGLGVAVGVLATQIDGGDGHGWQAAAVIGLLVPVVLAALVGGREVSLVRSERGARFARLSGTGRIISAGILVLFGIALPSSARSWFDLDIILVPGLLLMAIGVALIAPMLVAVAGRVLARSARRPSAHLAGGLVQARRRALGPAVCLVAAGSAAVVVQSVLGAGLVAREAHRRASLSVRAGTRADQVIVDAVSSPRSVRAGSLTSGPSASDYGTLTLADVARLGKAAPGAIVAPVVVPVSVPTSLGHLNVGPFVSFFAAVSVDRRTDAGSGRVALATPELTRALGLERFDGDVAAGQVLVLDPSVPVRDGVVTLMYTGTDGTTNFGSARLPARVVGGPAIPTRLPAAIVAESALQSRLRIGTQRAALGVVVRLSHPASRADVHAIAAAVPAFDALAGDSVDVDRLERTRLDAASSVVVRSSADVLRGVLLVAVAGVVALVVGLRFAALAHRAEDDLFEVVGAPSATLRRIAAWHGALVTIVGVGLGVSVGLIGTAWGIARYNSSGRGGLPPIPFDVPGLLVLGLVLVPVAGVAVAWASAGRRPAVDPSLLAERMPW